MAGYSGTPLHKKLGMKEGHRVALYGEPPDFLDLIGPASKALAISRRPRSGRFSVIVFFTKSAALLQKALPQLKSRMEPAAGLWIAWPKKASGVKTDVTEDTVRAFGLAAGLVDNKVCAIDETWSGLRLVIRVKDRARV
ncbi:DUF3052 domain-containing protein [cyanobacterium TDX16]|nr:DUF3052 domain-containing protein [cyanobacterium TDX16]